MKRLGADAWGTDSWATSAAIGWLIAEVWYEQTAVTRIVLLRPRNADNLGAIARAMKNFALSDWVVVSPNPKLLEVPGMNRLAVHAGELLESVRRVDSLAEAVTDCPWVVGTTMRRIEGRRR